MCIRDRQYRWDFNNDGIYDTPWINKTGIKHVYEKPYNGFARLQVKNEYGMTENLVRVIAVTQEEDQKQEKTEDFVKIYGSNKYAQTFIPTMLNLTGIKIYVARKGITCNEFPILKTLSKLFPNLFHNFFLGDLYIKIYEGKPSSGKMLTYVKVEASEISKSGAWISIDFPKGLIISEWNNYCSIAVEQSGGNERNYYKWYYAYNDPYPNGSFYYYEGGRWKEDSTRDFAFITYGKPTGDEPDGIEERWAVLLMGSGLPADDPSLEIMYNVLVERGWDSSKIWTIDGRYESKSKFWEAIEQMKKNEDMDDICLIWMSMHSGYIHYGSLDRKLDELGFACKGMLIIVESCGSGSAISYLAQPNRVIITSCKSDEKTGGVYLAGKSYGGWLTYFLADQTGACHRILGFPPKDPVFGAKDGAFARSDPDTSSEYGGNNDGWISAEEAYPFVCKWLGELTKDYPPEAQPHPQMYDGYPGDLKVVKWKEG